MAVYLLYVISPVLVAGLVRSFSNNPLSDEKNKNWCIVLCGIIMALMVCLRHEANGSGDSIVYCDIWERIARMDFGEFRVFMNNADMEDGFLISNFVLTRVFKDPQFVLVFSGLFFAISVCLFVKKNCKDVIIPFVVFNSLGLFNFMVQGLRQAMAMCICLYAFEMAKKKKVICFALIVALATTFHASAIVFAIVYAIRFLKINFPSMALFTIAGITGVIALPQLFELMNSVMNEEYSVGAGVDDSSGVITVLIYLLIVLFGFVFYEKKNRENDYSLFLYLSIISAIMIVLRNTTGTIVERVAFYFSFSHLVIISNALFNLKNIKTKAIFYMVTTGLLFLLAVHKASYSSLIPYNFFWQ